ncbi:hypothetical protein [Streptomyces sp. NPDC001781]
MSATAVRRTVLAASAAALALLATACGGSDGADRADEGTINMAAMASGKDYQAPADVIAAQVAKLG